MPVIVDRKERARPADPMVAPTILPLGQVVRLITQADRREFALFLGAGASVSSGIPAAGAMVREWRRMVFDDMSSDAERLALAGMTAAQQLAVVDAWCEMQGTPGYGTDDEYSLLFEQLYPNPRARQRFVEPKIEAAHPGWCYLYLANIVRAGHFNVIFTTNFDDLVNDALTTYLGYNPAVCAADSEVASLSITTDRAKIIKLHGDYLFKRLKNTTAELEQLDPNMEAKLKDFARECGLVVVGYAGRDRSVMRVIEELLRDGRTFPSGVYWGVRPDADGHYDLAPRVRELATEFGSRFKLFACGNFEVLMVRIHSALSLDLPNIYQPLLDSYDRLALAASADEGIDPTIRDHIRRLSEEQLDRPWARIERVADFDLIQAQMSIGQRDYRRAIELVSRYLEDRPEDVKALTTLGYALALQAQEEGSDGPMIEAAAKWEEAIRLDPKALAPRYQLVYYYGRKDAHGGIEHAEAVLALAPNDTGMRRQLANFYSVVGRHRDAQREIDGLIDREPEAADLRATKAVILAQRGLVPEALAMWREAVRLDPQNPSYHINLALQLGSVFQFDEAAEEHERGLQLAPANFGFRLQAAIAYAQGERLEPARAHLEEALRIEPSSAEARYWLGQVLYRLGNYHDAMRETEAALAASPTDSRILSGAGMIALQLGRVDLAERRWKAALAANRVMFEPYFMLSTLYLIQRRETELEATAEMLEAVAPTLLSELEARLAATMEYIEAAGAPEAVLLQEWAASLIPPPLPDPR